MLAGLLLSLLAVLPALVVGQNADCKISDYEWAYNDNDQSPCEVANSLVGTCSSSSPFQALGANIPMYGGPSDDSNACLCNLVEYNLLRVCSLCQGAPSDSYVQPYKEWAAHCSSVSVVEFPNPIPDGTVVPTWADKGDIAGDWSVDTLKSAAAAAAPAATASPSSSETSSSSSSSSTSPSSSTTTTTTSSSSIPPSIPPKSEANKGVILTKATTTTSTTLKPSSSASSMITSTRRPVESSNSAAIGSVVHQQLANDSSIATSSSDTISSESSSLTQSTHLQHLAEFGNTTSSPESTLTPPNDASSSSIVSASSTSLGDIQHQASTGDQAVVNAITDPAEEHHRRIKIAVIAGSLAGAFVFLFVIFRFWTCSQYRKELRETVDPDTFEKVLGNHRIRSSVWANLRDSIMPWRPAPQEQPPPLPVKNIDALRSFGVPSSLRPGSAMPDQANEQEVLHDVADPVAPQMDGSVPTIRVDDTTISPPAAAAQPVYEQREGERESWI